MPGAKSPRRAFVDAEQLLRAVHIMGLQRGQVVRNVKDDADVGAPKRRLQL